MASTIDWGKTIWDAQYGATGQEVTRTSASVANGATGVAAVTLQNVDNFIDANSQLISDSDVTFSTGTLYLGTDQKSTSDAAAKGEASESSSGLTSAFAKVGVAKSGQKLTFTSVELTGAPLLNAGSNFGTAVTAVLNLNSNTITELKGSTLTAGFAAAPNAIGDSIVVNNFGASGTIDLRDGADHISFAAGGGFSKKIIVDGGIGNDTVDAGLTAITYKMATYDKTSHSIAESDIVTNWSLGTIQLGEGKTFSSISLVNYGAKNDTIAVAGNAENNGLVFFNGDDKGDGTGTKKLYTSFSVVDVAGTGHVGATFGTYISDGKVTKKAVLTGANTYSSIADALSDSNLYVGSVSVAGGHGTRAGATSLMSGLSFASSTTKNRIYLGHSDGTGEEYEDTAQYINIGRVITSSVIGNSWAFGDVAESVQGVMLTAGGAGDSLCGLGGAADTLVGGDFAGTTGAKTGRVYFGVTNSSGSDVVTNFKTGNGKKNEKTDVALLIGGFDFANTKSDGTNLILSASGENKITLQEVSQNVDTDANGLFVNYQVGIGDEYASLYTALLDTKGGQTLEYSADADYIIGGLTASGETTLETGANKAMLNFGDGNKAMHGVKNIDASSALEGSMVLGNSDLAQSITGSASGTSFICGGFGGAMGDLNADTLVGGGVDSVTTGYFVGKNLGSDVVNNVTSKDVINFLNTNLSDFTGMTRTDSTVVCYFQGGNSVTVNAKDSFANVKDLTINFQDKSLTFDGKDFKQA